MYDDHGMMFEMNAHISGKSTRIILWRMATRRSIAWSLAEISLSSKVVLGTRMLSWCPN